LLDDTELVAVLPAVVVELVEVELQPYFGEFMESLQIDHAYHRIESSAIRRSHRNTVERALRIACRWR
jgi:hypothetical protein